MPREKSRHRDKRSSSYSSDSSRSRKKSKSKHRRRSRSRNRSEASSQRRKRSSSRSRHKRRSYTRSTSRDRFEKSRRRSSSRSRSKRDQSHSRSSSKSRSKRSKSHRKLKRRSRSSSSRSNSFDIERPVPRVNLDDTETKVERAIKAAEAAGLTMTKIPTYEYKEVDIKEDMPTIHDRNLLAELNNDSFVQKPFTSSRSKKESKNIVIDLTTDTIKLPEAAVKQKDDSIIDFDAIPSEEELREMWIRKLYQYRKKMLNEG